MKVTPDEGPALLAQLYILSAYTSDSRKVQMRAGFKIEHKLTGAQRFVMSAIGVSVTVSADGDLQVHRLHPMHPVDRTQLDWNSAAALCRAL